MFSYNLKLGVKNNNANFEFLLYTLIRNVKEKPRVHYIAFFKNSKLPFIIKNTSQLKPVELVRPNISLPKFIFILVLSVMINRGNIKQYWFFIPCDEKCLMLGECPYLIGIEQIILVSVGVAACIGG